MTDSIAVWPPGYRLTDNTTGDPMSGAVVEFYDANTTNPKTVYADFDLTTEIGTSITTDSLGRPTSDGSTPSMVYVGTAAYKAIIKTAAGVVIETHDNLKGAVVTVDATDLEVNAAFPVVTKSLDYTILAVDQLTHFQTNCSGGDVAYTLQSAVTVGTGWQVTIQHAGSANVVTIATVSGQTITLGATSYGTQYALARQGQEITLRSNGGNWIIAHETGNPITSGGVILVEDRVTEAPGSPVTGGYYLVTSAYSTFETHDVLFYTGASYVELTPAEDCGWVAFVKDEDLYYRFQGTAWVSEIAARSASQSDMETATSTTTFVTPAGVNYHPGVAKVLGKVTYSAGTPTLVSGSRNVTSITDTDQGQLTVTIATDFSDALYVVGGIAQQGTVGNRHVAVLDGSVAVGSFTLITTNENATEVDPVALMFWAWGDHA